MELALACKDSFPGYIRERGEDYFQSGRVENPKFSQSGHVASFVVHGSSKYEVNIDLSDLESDGNLSFQCDCPYYAEANFCKHLWAAILKLDSEKFAKDLVSNNALTDPRCKIHGKDGFGYEPSTSRNYYKTMQPEPPKVPRWQVRLDSIRHQNELASFKTLEEAKKTRSAFYLIDFMETQRTGELTVKFYGQETTRNGKVGPLKCTKVERGEISSYSDPEDKQAMSILLTTGTNISSYYYYNRVKFEKAVIHKALYQTLLQKICDAGKLLINSSGEYEKVPMCWAEPWKLELEVHEVNLGYQVKGFFKRGKDRKSLSSALVVLRDGLIVFPDCIARNESIHHYGWIQELRHCSQMLFPKNDGHKWVEAFYQDSNPPEIVWPQELQWGEVAIEPEPVIRFFNGQSFSCNKGVLLQTSFHYGETSFLALDSRKIVVDSDLKRILKRDLEKEHACLAKLDALGLALPPARLKSMFNYRINQRDFVATVKDILSWNWRVEAEGKKIQQAKSFDIGLGSGVDWFDLKGLATYANGGTMELPKLLSAIKRGENMVVLDDGSLGMIPEEWASRYAPLANFGSRHNGSIRFQKSQALLLNSWLDTDNEIKYDKTFLQLKKRLKKRNLTPSQEALQSFHGVLRPYQKEGLGWLDFLKSCEIGGILADDMGLGKTIQVLAHLDRERENMGTARSPSLAIVPKSLVFNWMEEAKRFTPELKVLNYTGVCRDSTQIEQHDLVLTTYATLRLDLEHLADRDFHYLILDEAQAIKNRDSLTSQACKKLKGRYKLIMTGTPVENSLNDLFSLMEFSSPGLLGPATVERITEASRNSELNKDAMNKLAKALRPFILRRTKSQVLTELPEKTEKTIYCELTPQERKQYEDLRSYYQQRLSQKIKEQGLGRVKFVVLEALLRLRQAACHPGLLDPKKKKSPSTKLDTLTHQVKEVSIEGHKVLVFSQFTSLLDIVRRRFDSEKISYEYLDGKTTNRQERVNRFQTDSTVSAFLISLKAGGVGLNLTAADYVFILDPWWNPAVESQAIDRTHRIGQTKKIIAYRLIAKDTVEEKIVSLQQTKRELADAIVSADTSLLRNLTLEDIRMLME